jgi:thiol-disulfide isomerase/thioredoxin
VSQRSFFALVAVLALAAGTFLWLLGRPPVPTARSAAPEIAAPALYATAFTDTDGRSQPLGRFQDRLLVLNFWATWCVPCREEMPAFARVSSRWNARGVQFLGISAEDGDKVARFGRELGITYPLWTGGDQVGELSRRLGNRLGVLPHTALIAPGGAVLETRVGPYTESELEQRLQAFAIKSN